MVTKQKVGVGDTDKIHYYGLFFYISIYLGLYIKYKKVLKIN